MAWTDRSTRIQERSKFGKPLVATGHVTQKTSRVFLFAIAFYSTCFNRIDLPNYTSKKELYEKLKAAVTLSGVGFDMD